MNTIEKFDVDLEIRSIQNKVNEGSLSVPDAKVQLDVLRVRKNELDKQEALIAAPLQVRASNYANMKDDMLQKRTVTLTGNGAINQVQDIVTLVQDKVPLLAEFKYFYGPNATTNIPILDPGVASPAEQVEGWDTPSTDSSAALSLVAVTPVGWTKTLPVSWEALNLNSANFEAQLPSYYAEVFGRTMHALGLAKMFHTSGVASGNKTVATGSGSTGVAYPTLHDFIDLSFVIAGKTILNPVIVCNSKIIVEALKTATDTATKIIAEEYYRNKTINGVKVVLIPGYTATTKDVIQVWAGDLSNVAFGVASDLMVEPKKQVGSANTFFDATMFFNAAIVQNKNNYAIIAK